MCNGGQTFPRGYLPNFTEHPLQCEATGACWLSPWVHLGSWMIVAELCSPSQCLCERRVWLRICPRILIHLQGFPADMLIWKSFPEDPNVWKLLSLVIILHSQFSQHCLFSSREGSCRSVLVAWDWMVSTCYSDFFAECVPSYKVCKHFLTEFDHHVFRRAMIVDQFSSSQFYHWKQLD